MTSFVENKLQEIDAFTLKQWMEEDGALLIDVREKKRICSRTYPWC